jgi:hypothetical protein
MPRTQHGTQLNEIYKKQYLKTVGKDDASKKRKREEALKHIDEWIEETYQTRDAERMFRDGENKWTNRIQEVHQQRWHDHRSSGAPPFDLEECSKAAEKQVIEEVGTQEEYATEYVENNLAPRGLLGVIVSIRDLLD